MKKYIGFLLIFITANCLAQKKDSVAFNGATKIIITNNNGSESNYKLAGTALIDNGYSIEKKDSEFFQLTSSPKEIEGTNYFRQLIFNITAKDDQIIIIPKTKRLNNLMGSLGTENIFEQLPFGKNKLSKDVYGRIEKLAKSIGGTLTYSE